MPSFVSEIKIREDHFFQTNLIKSQHFTQVSDQKNLVPVFFLSILNRNNLKFAPDVKLFPWREIYFRLSMEIVFLLKVMEPSHSYKQDGSVKVSSHMFIFQK